MHMRVLPRVPSLKIQLNIWVQLIQDHCQCLYWNSQQEPYHSTLDQIVQQSPNFSWTYSEPTDPTSISITLWQFQPSYEICQGCQGRPANTFGICQIGSDDDLNVRGYDI